MLVNLIIGQICSGKTTYSLELSKSRDHIRLGMDDLKIMMFNDIQNDKKTEDLIEASIDSMLNIIDGINGFKTCTIDGFQLNIEPIKYLVSCYPVCITAMTVDLYKANKRNIIRQKTDGIFIDPVYLKDYNESFIKFVNSSEFRKITSNISFMHNYEKKDKKCLVL